VGLWEVRLVTAVRQECGAVTGLCGFVGGETGYCSETCVTGGVGGTGEGSVELEEDIYIKEESIKVEEAVDIKEEMPEDIVFPPIKTEPEVRLFGVLGGFVCQVVTAQDYLFLVLHVYV
jgi:hypothetical protein